MSKKRNLVRRKSSLKGSENEVFSQEYLADVESESTNPMKVISQAQAAISRLKELSKKRRKKNINNLTSTLKPRSTVLHLDVTNDEAKTVKRSQSLIRHFINLDKNCSEDDEVDLNFIQHQLDSGADINFTDKYGQTILHEAAREWHPDVSLFLLKRKANINATDNFGRTPLHVAAATDYKEMVQILIENGADREARAKGGQTPLHYAASNDAVESLIALIESGADTESRDYKNRTPLFLAAELDRSETARELVERGAQVSVVDQAGYKCITHMIIKMAPVANIALDKFHRKDRRNRKQFFQLFEIECSMLEEKKEASSLAKTPLEAIVLYKQLDLILHPVIIRLIDVTWNSYGRKAAWINLLINILYVLIWTVFAVISPWYLRPVYSFPKDTAKLIFLIAGFIFTIYFVIDEVREIMKSRKKFKEWKRWRISEIKRDFKLCHPKWPDEADYLKEEINSIENSVSSYFQDMWNYFDWIVYSLSFLVLITHIIDAARPFRVPICCSPALGCETPADTYACDEEDSYVNNQSLTVWNNRIFAITIICMWLRLMKYARAFRQLGPFIVMLTKLGSDILRFLYLYLEFFIPYSIVFWMTFGGIAAVPSLSQVDKLMISLYRLTLVDDYEYDAMTGYDVVMSYFLIVTFTFLSAVLCLNLFIALLSDTFQRVYDNARANAVMQQASLLLNFQSIDRKSRFHEHLMRFCNPEEMSYDDDLTTPGDENLKKVTFQMKDQLDFLIERLNDEPQNILLEDEIKETQTRSGVEVKKKERLPGSELKVIKREIKDIKLMLHQIIQNQTSSINEINKTILMTRPLKSPSVYEPSYRRSQYKQEISQEQIPGAVGDEKNEIGLKILPQLRMAEIRINLSDEEAKA